MMPASPLRPHRRSTPAAAFVLVIALASMTGVCLAAAGASLSPSDARAVVERVVDLIGAHYVFPERRAQLVEALRAGLKAGRYETSDAAELSARVTSDLSAASHDKHLSLGYNPSTYELLRGSEPTADRGPWSDDVIRARNSGFEELRILPGNVRYARVSNFMWLEGFTPAVSADATRFLAGGRAAIIDLRGNGGGDPRAVQHLVSPFLEEGRLLMTFHDGLTGATSETSALSRPEAGRLAGHSLFVLVDDGTASAAEEFAYHVVQFKLGRLVGATTAGAANNNTLFPIAPGFVASVSTGRPVHPVSGVNWEGVGVAPDVASAPDRALQVAQVLAVDESLASASKTERARLEWVLVALRAEARPITLAPGALAEYAGRYGIRSVRVDGSVLVYQRDGGDPLTLSPLGDDLFAFPNTDEVRVRFRRANGQVSGFDQVTSDGQVLPSERTGGRSR
jgi:hypothetical protein